MAKSNSKSSSIVSGDGKLTSMQAEAKKLKKVFDISNNNIATIVENQNEAEAELKQLQLKKRDLTKDINKKIKEKKQEMNANSQKILIALGDRNGVYKALAQLGYSLEAPKKLKEIPASLGIEVEVE
jgi:uncharacterized membrane protein